MGKLLGHHLVVLLGLRLRLVPDGALNIVADLFRDHAMNGWVKAIWIIFLIFVPFLTALVYLIARGGGMAERNASVYREQQHAADSYIRSVAGSSATDEIEKAAKLRDAGTITEEEFAGIKARVLR
jgi:hypothetical protein